MSLKSTRPGPVMAIAIGYLVLASAIMFLNKVTVSPDYILLLMVPVALALGRLGRFLKDWVPFIVLFLGWEAMRGLAPKLGVKPSVTLLSDADKALFFGHLPTQVFQDITSWIPGLGIIGTLVYFCHFLFPLGVGLILWLRSRARYLRFVTALLGMSFSAYIIYLLFPTAPPWYAQDHGVICCFQHVIANLSNQIVPGQSPIYEKFNPNQFAAFPSLHAAFPFLAYLALRPAHKKASWLALGWCFLVWFFVVYLGEHYVVDVLAGIAFASLTWLVMTKVVVPRVGVLRADPEGEPLPPALAEEVA